MKLKISPLLLILASACFSCSSPSRKPVNFAFQYRYGVGARDDLNTFTKTFTYDLVENGTITVPFVLSDSEMTLIWNRLNEIDFFSFPDTFKVDEVHNRPGPAPVTRFDILVRGDSITKHVYWTTAMVDENDIRQTNLGKLDRLIFNIIIRHPEYAKLPMPKGRYL